MASTSVSSKADPATVSHRPVEAGPVRGAMMSPPAPWLRRTIGGLSALAGLVALSGFGLGLAEIVGGQASPGAFWMMLFQFCALVACMMGVLSGAGRFTSGPAMTPLIVGGVLLVGAIFSEPSLVRSGMPRLEVMGVPLRPLALTELVFALALGGLSLLVVLLRKPKKTIPMTLIGIALVAPAMAAAVSFLLPQVRGVLSGWSPVVMTLVVVAVLGIAGVLLSIGSQFVIRAIEVGIDEGLPDGDAEAS
jgi:hypothetical protein